MNQQKGDVMNNKRELTSEKWDPINGNWELTNMTWALVSKIGSSVTKMVIQQLRAVWGFTYLFDNSSTIFFGKEKYGKTSKMGKCGENHGGNILFKIHPPRHRMVKKKTAASHPGTSRHDPHRSLQDLVSRL